MSPYIIQYSLIMLIISSPTLNINKQELIKDLGQFILPCDLKKYKYFSHFTLNSSNGLLGNNGPLYDVYIFVSVIYSVNHFTKIITYTRVFASEQQKENPNLFEIELGLQTQQHISRKYEQIGSTNKLYNHPNNFSIDADFERLYDFYKNSNTKFLSNLRLLLSITFDRGSNSVPSNYIGFNHTMHLSLKLANYYDKDKIRVTVGDKTKYNEMKYKLDFTEYEINAQGYKGNTVLSAYPITENNTINKPLNTSSLPINCFDCSDIDNTELTIFKITNSVLRLNYTDTVKNWFEKKFIELKNNKHILERKLISFMDRDYEKFSDLLGKNDSSKVEEKKLIKNKNTNDLKQRYKQYRSSSNKSSIDKSYIDINKSNKDYIAPCDRNKRGSKFNIKQELHNKNCEDKLEYLDIVNDKEELLNNNNKENIPNIQIGTTCNDERNKIEHQKEYIKKSGIEESEINKRKEKVIDEYSEKSFNRSFKKDSIEEKHSNNDNSDNKSINNDNENKEEENDENDNDNKEEEKDDLDKNNYENNKKDNSDDDENNKKDNDNEDKEEEEENDENDNDNKEEENDDIDKKDNGNENKEGEENDENDNDNKEEEKDDIDKKDNGNENKEEEEENDENSNDNKEEEKDDNDKKDNGNENKEGEENYENSNDNKEEEKEDNDKKDNDNDNKEEKEEAEEKDENDNDNKEEKDDNDKNIDNGNNEGDELKQLLTTKDLNYNNQTEPYITPTKESINKLDIYHKEIDTKPLNKDSLATEIQTQESNDEDKQYNNEYQLQDDIQSVVDEDKNNTKNSNVLKIKSTNDKNIKDTNITQKPHKIKKSWIKENVVIISVISGLLGVGLLTAIILIIKKARLEGDTRRGNIEENQLRTRTLFK